MPDTLGAWGSLIVDTFAIFIVACMVVYIWANAYLVNYEEHTFTVNLLGSLVVASILVAALFRIAGIL